MGCLYLHRPTNGLRDDICDLCVYVCVQWGILVMILHDVSDVVLEASKLCQYMQLEVAKDCGFVIFALTFFVTRLVMYGTQQYHLRIDVLPLMQHIMYHLSVAFRMHRTGERVGWECLYYILRY